jgi:hypothetical protein
MISLSYERVKRVVGEEEADTMKLYLYGSFRSLFACIPAVAVAVITDELAPKSPFALLTMLIPRL